MSPSRRRPLVRPLRGWGGARWWAGWAGWTGGGLLMAACLSAAWAGPAPWYQWRSDLQGQTLCAQVSPGAAWVRVDGPYLDSDCRRPPPRRQPM